MDLARNLIGRINVGDSLTRSAALAVASGNSADFLAVYYACAKLGVVCVPVNLGWRPDEVAYVLGHSRAREIVVETQLVAVMQDAIAKVPEVFDVIVAPGTSWGSRVQAEQPDKEPADRAWTTIGALAEHD